MSGNFEAVWSRVTGQTAAQQPTECRVQELPVFLRESVAAAAAYRHMIGKTGNAAARSVLQRCLAEELQLQRRLYSARYRLTGDGGPVPRTAEMPKHLSLSDALRERCLRESASAQAYGAAARCASGSLSKLYKELAKVEAEHAARLERLLDFLF